MCELLGAYVGEQSLHLGIRRGIALVEIAQRRSELAVGSAKSQKDMKSRQKAIHGNVSRLSLSA